jgi:MFS family permease
MRLLAPALGRARAHADLFPRPFRSLIAGQAVFSVGSGTFVPYLAIYLTRDLGASGAQAGAIIAVAGMVGLIGSPVGGVLADRVGRRPMILVSLAGNGTILILIGSLSSLLAIAVIVPFWGIVGDLMGPAVSAAIADMVVEERRVEAYALQRVVSNLAFAVGPPLGALIALVSSLRWTFIVAGFGCLVYFTVVWFRVPETRPEHVEHHGEGTRIGTALRDRKLVALVLASALATYIYVQWTDVGGLFLVHDRGYSAATWGLCFGINPILVAAGQYPLARWARKRSPRVILAAGAVLQGLALTMLLPFSPLAWLIASVLVFTLGEMLIAPIATALAASLAPAHLRGSYQGVLNFAFAGAFGPAVFIGVALVGAGHGAWMLSLALPLSVLAAALTWPLPSKPFAAETDGGLAPA